MGLGQAETQQTDSVRGLVGNLPRPVRFLIVGSLGLVTDLSVFTAIPMHASQPIAARVVSLSIATLVTWRLNRALTFDPSGRLQRGEAARYAAVTLTAQSVSFAVFSILVLTILATYPQAALLAGAGASALFSYIGHLFFAFAPDSETFQISSANTGRGKDSP